VRLATVGDQRCAFVTERRVSGKNVPMDTDEPEIRRLTSADVHEQLDALASVLVDCVAGGASVSYLTPFSHKHARSAFEAVAAEVEQGRRLLLAAFADGDLVGTVQVILALPPNQPHRAEIAKLLVHRSARRRGVAQLLMDGAEAEARAEGKTLLVLDTVTGDNAERLYERLGWTKVGVIPGYALYPDGRPCDTTIFWKSLAASVTLPIADWEQRISDLWASIDDHSEEEFLARMEELATELPADSAVAVFERASSFDSTGHSDLAVPLYRQALELGLDGERRRRAVIQLASSLRNTGRAPESIALLTAEQNAASDELDDAVSAFLALALVDVGREREAVSLALTALSRHLTRYQRSLANYAQEISDRSHELVPE
jgi:ribosomal protein S18 acetylase RimI-like enzyme